MRPPSGSFLTYRGCPGPSPVCFQSSNIVAKVPLNDMARLRSGMILYQTRLWAPRTDDEINPLNGAYTENPQQHKSGSIMPHPTPQQNHGHSVSENARFHHVCKPSQATLCLPGSFAAKERLQIRDQTTVLGEHRHPPTMPLV